MSDRNCITLGKWGSKANQQINGSCRKDVSQIPRITPHRLASVRADIHRYSLRRGIDGCILFPFRTRRGVCRRVHLGNVFGEIRTSTSSADRRSRPDRLSWLCVFSFAANTFASMPASFGTAPRRNAWAVVSGWAEMCRIRNGGMPFSLATASDTETQPSVAASLHRRPVISKFHITSLLTFPRRRSRSDRGPVPAYEPVPRSASADWHSDRG